ncbi:helix-turn-helix transcriptional regulator [Paenibacillus sp. FSL H8-0548]|uniref:helix-turn-helix transcriptional regulator n=1 Tax=Paenibacillus sp. FSL H8-0548 TaxID=1920422 RepID=UPI00096DB5F9|nr:helix-turn-helix transcriptional regulator [Paenibacillus sp. FSL H8-0548]OMF28078.1 helix-turn-helix transcriptional regulator [Paenibacillus sp. FSL H8-0548]
MANKLDSIKRQLIKLDVVPQSSQLYREAALSILREAVPFSAACCTSVDPITLLSTGSSTDEDIEAIHHQLFEYEYWHEDYNSFEKLAQSAMPAAALSEATEGQLDRSARYREVLAPAGFRDELRTALVIEGACWGYITLFRKADEPLFAEEECRSMASLAPIMAKALKRRGLELPSANASVWKEETGIIVLSEQLEICSLNQEAKHWLQELRSMENMDNHVLPRPVLAVCSRALTPDGLQADSMKFAKVCIRTPNGLYLSIRASKLAGVQGQIQLAVSIEPAKPTEILPFIAQAYALTARENQIIERIIRGFSTKEMAHSLHISAYTVQDHLKSIFSKTNVSSRRELLWELFSRHS